MLNYYLKELLSNTFSVNGAPVRFEGLANNRGVIALDDEKPEHKPMVAALDDASLNHRGGIVKISADTYLKKKQENNLLRSNSLRQKSARQDVMLHAMRTQLSPFPKGKAAVAGVVSTSGINQANIPPRPIVTKGPTLSPRAAHFADKAAKATGNKPATAKTSRATAQAQGEAKPAPPAK